MVHSKLIKAIFCLSLVVTLGSCSSDREEEVVQQPVTLQSQTFKNLYAPQMGGQGQPVSGTFTKFSFSKNAVVTDGSWDIAFRGTAIIVNGGTAVGVSDEPAKTGNAAVSTVQSTLDAVKSVPEASTFKQDANGMYAIASGSGNGWYQYNPANHLISPIPGKVFVIRTHDGKYAKMEILSFYKDAPSAPDPLTTPSNYFTFKFVYQSNGNNF
ncbi:MAG: HmuY family protein [Bacteroidetes bacterium]|nr:HmuY family protein [Bacteroidota bacterium]